MGQALASPVDVAPVQCTQGVIAGVDYLLVLRDVVPDQRHLPASGVLAHGLRTHLDGGP